jgi:hypothetical protein
MVGTQESAKTIAELIGVREKAKAVAEYEADMVALNAAMKEAETQQNWEIVKSLDATIEARQKLFKSEM